MPGDGLTHTQVIRVRYSETDQMGTFYNSRALEWFECGRTELLRAMGMPYAEMERRGVMLPLVEAHVNYRGRARYDDELVMTSRITMSGRASLRFDVEIVQKEGGERTGAVASGYTVHAIVGTDGKVMRAPEWLVSLVSSG